VDVGIPLDDPRVARFSELLIQELKARGYGISDREYREAARQRELESFGAVHNVHSGRIDKAAQEAFVVKFNNGLIGGLRCDAKVSPVLATVSAPFSTGLARWDGAVGRVGSSDYAGTVPALSVWIKISDLYGVELFFRSGGIQVLQKLDTGFLSAKLQSIPKDEIMVSDDRMRAGIRLALEELGTRRPTRPEAGGIHP
jgi:hypothetical protein